MSTKFTILLLLFICMVTTSFQCDNCNTQTLLLDHTKSWFPLKGITQLTFMDSINTPVNFILKVTDTLGTGLNDCGDVFRYEYIQTSLYLNQSKTDSIHFSLGSGGGLCMRAISGNDPNIAVCNVFGQTREGIIAKKFMNYKVGNKMYREVILILHGPGFSDNIDSVFIANNSGIVGFRYAAKTYALK